jgi:hypothetical protein
MLATVKRLELSREFSMGSSLPSGTISYNGFDEISGANLDDNFATG